jgi:hypothetical protein
MLSSPSSSFGFSLGFAYSLGGGGGGAKIKCDVISRATNKKKMIKTVFSILSFG